MRLLFSQGRNIKAGRQYPGQRRLVSKNLAGQLCLWTIYSFRPAAICRDALPKRELGGQVGAQAVAHGSLSHP